MKRQHPSMPGAGRRGFLKAFVLAGASAPALRLVGAEAPAAAVAVERVPATPLGQRTLGAGRAALTASALGFGVMGLNHHRGPHPDRQAAIRLLREAAERGVTLFDTAAVYGPWTNEELAAEGLAPFRDRVFVTTKFGHEVVDGKATGRQDSSPAAIRRECEAALRRLRTDCIPLYYQHRGDGVTPPEEVAGTIAELMREGKVRRWGMCEVSAETIRRAYAVCPLTAVQSEWHLMWREPERNGVLEACRALGIGFVPYSPLNRGFLGGDLNEYSDFGSGNDNRAGLPRFTPANLRANGRFVAALHAFGQPRGMTPAQVALGWLLWKAPWVLPIPGTTKRAHLWENLETLSFHLPDADWQALEATVGAIPVQGARYGAAEQRRVDQG